jgi:uncharacterized integral membrane protein
MFALLAFYFGDVPWPLVIAVFAAIVGGGETVRKLRLRLCVNWKRLNRLQVYTIVRYA